MSRSTAVTRCFHVRILGRRDTRVIENHPITLVEQFREMLQLTRFKSNDCERQWAGFFGTFSRDTRGVDGRAMEGRGVLL